MLCERSRCGLASASRILPALQRRLAPLSSGISSLTAREQLPVPAAGSMVRVMQSPSPWNRFACNEPQPPEAWVLQTKRHRFTALLDYWGQLVASLYTDGFKFNGDLLAMSGKALHIEQLCQEFVGCAQLGQQTALPLRMFGSMRRGQQQLVSTIFFRGMFQALCCNIYQRMTMILLGSSAQTCSMCFMLDLEKILQLQRCYMLQKQFSNKESCKDCWILWTMNWNCSCTKRRSLFISGVLPWTCLDMLPSLPSRRAAAQGRPAGTLPAPAGTLPAHWPSASAGCTGTATPPLKAIESQTNGNSTK